MCKIRNYCLALLALIACVSILNDARASSSWGDEETRQNLKALSELIGQPRSERKLPEGKALPIISIVQNEKNFSRIIAAHVLAFATDAKSLEVLKELSREKSNEAFEDMQTAGVANYAILVRESSHLDSPRFFNALRDRLQQSKNPVERMFISNRLYVDFDKQAIPVILKAARAEAEMLKDNVNVQSAIALFNGMARTDMLYYLSQSDDIVVLREISTWKPYPEAREGGFDPAYLELLNTLTPGRSDNMDINLWLVRQKAIQKKLENKIN